MHEPDEAPPDGPTSHDLCRELVASVAKNENLDETDILSCCAAAIGEIRRFAASHDVKWGDLQKKVSSHVAEKRKEMKKNVDAKPL